MSLEAEKTQNRSKAEAGEVEKIVEQPSPHAPSAPYSEIPARRRKLILLIVTGAGFLGPVAGNIYIPLLPLYEKVFKSSSTTTNGTVSVFMFTFGVAPLFWASLADKSGRRVLYLISLPFFIVSTLLLAAIPPRIVALYILRVVQAFGASSLVSVGAGTIADTVEPKHRAKSISYFLLGPQLGPIVGLILSLVGSNGQWRWTFGILTILSGVMYLIIFFFLPETLRAIVGNGNCYIEKGYVISLKESFSSKESRVAGKKKISIFRIVFTVLSYILILWCSVIGAFLFASFYCLSVSFTSVLKKRYGFTQAEVCVSYLCPGIALIAGSIVTGRISDKLHVRGLTADKTPNHPERRLAIQSIGLVTCIIGLTCYGWAVEKHWHVASVFVFAFLISCGMSSVSVINMTYMTECQTGYISTNVAVGNMTRNLAAGVASLVVEKLISAMGYGWCFTGLGILNVFSVIMSVILTKFGQKWNQKLLINRSAN